MKVKFRKYLLCLLISPLLSFGQKIDYSLKKKVGLFGFVAGSNYYDCFYNDVKANKTVPLSYFFKWPKKFFEDTLAVTQKYISYIKFITTCVMADSSFYFDTLHIRFLDLDSNYKNSLNVLVPTLDFSSDGYHERINVLCEIPYYKCIHYYNESDGIEIFKLVFDKAFIKNKKIVRDYSDIFGLFYVAYVYPLRDRIVNHIYVFLNDESGKNYGYMNYTPNQLEKMIFESKY